MNFRVISFYTIGTGYEAEAKALKQSLERLNIPHSVHGIPDLGSWHSNSLYKPLFIREMLSTLPDPALVWLDADAVVLRLPELFNMIDTDAAFYFKTTGPAAKRMGGHELITASMYFANNDRTKSLMEMWAIECSNPHPQDPVLIEQRSLQRVLPAWRAHTRGTVTYLPQSYCRIFDAPEDERVIIQNQASRRLANGSRRA